MACVTLVITSPCSGTSNLLIDHNVVICETFIVEDLAKGICLTMTRKYNPVAIREYVINSNACDKIANEYVSNYKEIFTI